MAQTPGGLTLTDLAAILNGQAEGDPNTWVSGVSTVEDATPGTVVRVETRRFLQMALESAAAVLLVAPGLTGVTKPCVRVPHVRLAFLRCLELFENEPHPTPGVHATVVLGEGVAVGEGCSLGPRVVLGDRVVLHDRVTLHPGVVVGDDVTIGADSVLFPNVVLYPRTVVGRRVRIHAGAVLGADGYGYEWDGVQHRKRPHLGRVRIADDVEIGANTTIDRATTGETVIGPGSKLDNLVQVGHNVRTGAHCLLIATSALPGSVQLGNGVVLAGYATANPGTKLADGVILGGKSAAWDDISTPGHWTGNPARPHREYLRVQAALNRLPELLERVKELEQRLAEATGDGD